MSIEELLDKDGKGVLTPELFQVFVANGCHPECHICDKKLKAGEHIHLKAFFVKTTDESMLTGGSAQAVSDFIEDVDDFTVPQFDGRGTTTSSIDVMICEACSKANKSLPRGEADKLLAVAHVHGLIEPTSPAQGEKMGKVGPNPPYNYPSRRSGGHGGCMIVRKPNEDPLIIGSEER